MISFEREIQLIELRRAVQATANNFKKIHRETEFSIKKLDSVYARFKDDHGFSWSVITPN